MSQCYYKQYNQLIVPNKCASVTVGSVLNYAQVPTPEIAQIFANRRSVQVWATTRNPVDYFVSGYRYLYHAQDDDTPVQRTFSDHLLFCVDQAAEFTEHYPGYFAGHAWWGPLRTVRLDWGIDKPVNWIKLEDPNSLWLHMRKLYNIHMDRSLKLNTSPKTPPIEFTDTVIDLIKQLENWSEECDYDIESRAETLSRTINTV